MARNMAAAKERILDAAYARFSRYGVRKVTMDDLASDLRMSKKTLYKYFSGKEELVKTLVEEKCVAPHEDIMEIMEGGGSTVRVFGAVFPLLGRYAQEVSTVFLGDVRREYPQVWELHERRRADMVHRFTALLAQGVENGEIRSCIQPEVAAGIVQCVVANYMVPERFRDSGHSVADIFVTWFSMLTGGMFNDPPDVQSMWETRVMPLANARMAR